MGYWEQDEVQNGLHGRLDLTISNQKLASLPSTTSGSPGAEAPFEISDAGAEY